MIYKINPFPAVRTTKKGNHTDRAKDYHSKMNYLRLLIKDKQKVIDTLIEGNYTLVFNMQIPKSKSKKTKAEMIGTPHKQTPDIDNLFKAFTDTVFYVPKGITPKYNDSSIHTINTKKVWSEEGSIELINTLDND